MRKASLQANAVLNIVKNLIGILFPLITYPYAARVLEAENLGKVAYAQSIVSYFALIAALGVTTYAVREGAKYRDNNEKIGGFANEIFTTNIITTLISYGLLLVCLLLINKLASYSGLILLLSSSIAFTTIGVDWINVIYEDFFVTTIRGILIQILNLILLFVFVKTPSDYYIYAFLTVLANIIICLWNFIYCRRYLRVKLVRRCNFFKHIKPMFVFFANSLATTIYCSVGSTMLGWMIGDVFVGIYSVAVKVYTIIKTLLAAAYTVCIPRLSNYYGKGDHAGFKKLIDTLLSVLILLLFPAMMGLIMLAEPIIMFLGGAGYEAAIPTLQILSVALVFSIVSGVFSSCINIPTGKEKLSLTATMIAAIVNVIMNIFLIPLCQHNGAAVATVIAEISVMLVCFFGNKETRTMITGKTLLKNMTHGILGSACIAGIVLLLKQYIVSGLLLCIVSVAGSVLVYGILLLLLKNDYAIYGLRVIRKKLHK